MKKLLSALLALVFCAFVFVGCSQPAQNGGTPADTDSGLKIGVILLHNEDIGYDEAHMKGIQSACESLDIDWNDKDQVLWKYNIPESAECYDAAMELADQGCNLIISDSFGHQSYMTQAAEECKDVHFLIATGDTAAVDNCENTHNFFTHTYESRFVSGVVAGMKLEELIKDSKLTEQNYNADGQVKIGYVGAYPYAEVVSGYTAFYLGVKSVVENVAMEVTYTSAWADAQKEQAAAESLLSKGCCIISQHADSTGGPSAIEKAVKEGAVCYYVGYNVDMLAVAPTVILTSAQNNWAVYYKYAFELAKAGKFDEIADDWSEGYDNEANMISELGASCAAGTAEKVAEVEAQIKAGTLKVFDTDTFTIDTEKQTTFSKLTVDENKRITSYTFNSSTMNSDYTAILYTGEDYEAIVDGAFNESVFRSAPYFDLRVDGITE